MRVLVLGAEGMLGSAIMREFPGFIGASRIDRSSCGSHNLYNVDITCKPDLTRAFSTVAPDAVINCAGIVKSECALLDPLRVAAINSEAPHLIASVAASYGCRVIHLSTDCVFDGSAGGRTEEDAPNATDLYGQTKAAGELAGYKHCVTLRTSFIGRDSVHGRGLLEWLLIQRNDVPGYTRALWSGLSTHELARAIGMVLSYPKLTGLYHVSGPVISKADLLHTLIEALRLPCRVCPVKEPHLDRSLSGSRFEVATGYSPPAWINMAQELA